jgi:PAS domain S-box-containing protein
MSLLVGIVCGLAVWWVLDPIQTHELSDIFHKQQLNRIEARAADARRRFEYYLGEIERGLRGLGGNWRLADYLQRVDWTKDPAEPLIFNEEIPVWLDKDSPCLSLMDPSKLVLLDSEGRVREIVHYKKQPFPMEQALEFFDGDSGATITSIWHAPYFLAWTEMPEGVNGKPGFLMAVVPISQQMLSISQQSVETGDLVVGLFNANQQRVLSSSNRQLVGTTDQLPSLREIYYTTSLALTHYQAADFNIQFFALLPKAQMEVYLQRTLSSVRRLSILEALVYVAVFTLAFFLLSSHLSHVLRRISLFSEQALGLKESGPVSGNQLVLLENRLIDLLQQVSSVSEQSQEAQQSRIVEAEALKTTLLDNALDPIITVDAKGKIIVVNVTAVEVFGFNREQMLGKKLDTLLIHPKDRRHFRQLLTRCRQPFNNPALCRSQKLQGIDSSGVEKPLECSVMPVYFKNRTVFTVYLRDITERERAELQIKSLANFARENPSPVLRINNRGVIIYANLASDPLLEYWDCERGQTLPLYWRNLVFKALADGKNREYEIKLEEMFFSVLMAPVLELDYVNLYGRDITQVRTAELQSRQHQSELVHVCRLSTMGEMATGLAHELNQPLSAIVNFASGCVRRLESGIGDEAELIDAMAQITIQADRAGEIIKRLRSLVAKQAEERAVVNLNHLVLEVASFVEYDAARHHVELSLDLEQGALPVNADLVQIEQVLLNLVRNAIDALKQVDLERRKLKLITRRPDENRVEVLVRDTGPGIAPDTLEHLFDAFFSTKESGIGMGLPISRKIVESHNGQIIGSSELGQGAEFKVVLPTSPELQLPGF